MEIIIIRIMIKLLNQYLFYVTPAKTISTESTRNDLYNGMCGLVVTNKCSYFLGIPTNCNFTKNEF